MKSQKVTTNQVKDGFGTYTCQYHTLDITTSFTPTLDWLFNQQLAGAIQRKK